MDKHNFNDRFKKSTILVTGGAGFIGSHIVEKLLYYNSKVIVLDDFSTGKRENIDFNKKNLEVIKGSVENFRLLKKITKKVDYISHQAALTSVPASIEESLTYQKVNVEGTVKLLRAAEFNQVKRFVFASSSSVYGKLNKYPQKENYLPQPVSPYASSKLAGENYCQMFTRCYGLETLSLRYFNVFGPRQSLENEYAAVIPKFITSLLEDKATPIYGDGTQSRDFTYVENIVKANLLAFFTSQGIGKTINIGSGKSISILKLSYALQKLLRLRKECVFLPVRPGDVRKTEADLNRAKKYLNFIPEIGFEPGLKKTINWYELVQSS